MADLYLQRLGMPPQFVNSGTPSAGAFACDASNDGIGAVVPAPTTDPITHIGFRYGLRTGTPPTYVIGFEGLSSGNPDGTYLGGGSPNSGTFTPPADTTWDNLWQWAALDNAYSPAAIGEALAIALRYSSGTVSGSHFSSFVNEVSSLASSGLQHFPYSLRLTAGSWSKRTSLPAFGLRTASNRYGYYYSGHYTTTVSTSGHRSAMKFRVPTNATNAYKVAGVKFWGTIGNSTGQSPTVAIWNSSGVVASVTISTTNDIGANTRCLREFYFSTTPDLTPGTDYYVGIQLNATSAAGLAGYQLADSGDLVMFPGGSQWHLATYNGSAWTDDQTVRPACELILADMTQASGGGGGGVVIGNGGPVIRGLY